MARAPHMRSTARAVPVPHDARALHAARRTLRRTPHAAGMARERRGDGAAGNGRMGGSCGNRTCPTSPAARRCAGGNLVQHSTTSCNTAQSVRHSATPCGVGAISTTSCATGQHRRSRRRSPATRCACDATRCAAPGRGALQRDGLRRCVWRAPCRTRRATSARPRAARCAAAEACLRAKARPVPT